MERAQHSSYLGASIPVIQNCWLCGKSIGCSPQRSALSPAGAVPSPGIARMEHSFQGPHSPLSFRVCLPDYSGCHLKGSFLVVWETSWFQHVNEACARAMCYTVLRIYEQLVSSAVGPAFLFAQDNGSLHLLSGVIPENGLGFLPPGFSPRGQITPWPCRSSGQEP